jgi:hypothetical protein
VVRVRVPEGRVRDPVEFREREREEPVRVVRVQVVRVRDPAELRERLEWQEREREVVAWEGLRAVAA